MRTTTDIRTAFEEFADRAPSEVHLLLDDPQPRHRNLRPVLATAMAVAAVVALAAALAAALAPSHHHPGPAKPPPAPVSMRFGFTIDPATGYELVGGDIGVFGDGQIGAVGQGAVIKDGHTLMSMLLYGVGVDPAEFDPAEAMRGTPVDVNGHRGYFTDLSTYIGNYNVAWEYAPGAWGVLGTDSKYPSAGAAKKAEVGVAKAVRFTKHGPLLRVPFRIGYLPPDVALSYGAESTGVPPRRGQFTFSGASPDEMLKIELSSSGQCFAGGASVTVNGYRGCIGHPSPGGANQLGLYLQVPGGWLTIEASWLPYSEADLRAIAGSMTVARLDQPGSWFDADTAVPH